MNKKNKIVVIVLAVVVVLVVAPIVIGVLTANKYLALKYEGVAMTPTYSSGQIIVATKHPLVIARYDVIIFKTAGLTINTSHTGSLMSRVIGLPGDHVTIQNGIVTVYNSSNPSGFDPDSNQSYLSSGTSTAGNINVTVPSNSYFVLGDNRADSLDSREFGTVSKDNIIGIVTNSNNWQVKIARNALAQKN